jgi:cytochrome c oxidase cbb3-type subunit I/II
MLNGLLTLRGAWDKVRDSAVLKFMVVAVTAYGMATFEGPLLSIKSVNAISHFTDWTIGHVHIGALGWNGFLTFGILYWLIPRIFQTKLYSEKMANLHFWIGFLGIIIYAVPLYFAGITQSLMWKEFTPDGVLRYPNFLETVLQIIPMYIIRAIGGGLYIVGAMLGAHNLAKTIRQGKLLADEPAQAPARLKDNGEKEQIGHRWLEHKPILFLVLTTVAVAIGGLVEIVPTFLIKSQIPTISAVKPLTPLELQGRDIYIREGCNTCHSQLIRPFRSETERYGEYSKAGEFVYDHPFLWGSKRTGPDLAREGSRYPDAWHYMHMKDPTSMSPGSIMPSYQWLLTNKLDATTTASKIGTLRLLGVPYPKDYELSALSDLEAQAEQISTNLRNGNIDCDADREIIAVIAYLQRLGTDIKPKTNPVTPVAVEAAK